MKNYTLLFLLLAGLVINTSCGNKLAKRLNDMKVENPTTQADKDQNIIVDYAVEQGLDGQFTDSGIYYVLENPGEGDARPDRNSQIVAHYKGTLLNGKKFDSSYDRNDPLRFPLGRVIQGWQEAIPMMGKGGKGTFIIPSGLAYGARGAGADIGPNSVLRFDIELLDF